MKKAIASILVVIMVLQIFTLFVKPVNAEPIIIEKIDNFRHDKLDQIVPDEIIVKFKDEINTEEISRINSKFGTSVLYTSEFAGFHRIKLPKGKTVAEIVNKYKNNPNVEYAEPNYIAHICMVPNDPYYSYQWHMHDITDGGINMEPAWDISTGSGTIIAVVDTGIRIGTDLSETCFVAGHDFVNDDNNPIDDNGHGTHVAGTIAQSTNNNEGVAGVAFDACLMPVKVLDANGYGTYADIIDGINFAVDNGADIISMSFGGSSSSTGLENALANAYNSGVTCIAAAGNGGGNGIDYPAAYDDYVIAVGATQYDRSRAPYSDYGLSLDVVAPGGNINIDQNGDGYGDGVLQQTFEIVWIWLQWGYYFFQGTSMATPHVSGTAALLYSNGVTSPDNIRDALQSTAYDLGTYGRDIYYGYGLINAYDALQYSGGDSPPTCTITAPINGATVIGNVNIEATASDDNEVTQVDFYVDSTYFGTDTIEPYSWLWDSTSVADGIHTITATAIDTISQSTSDSIDVIVDNKNDPPVADAGPDQTVTDIDGNNEESVTLDGTNSYDPDGTINSYQWKEGETVLGTSEIITYDFSIGIHIVTLTVTDDDGDTSTDDCTITVVANQAPIADAGPDQTNSDSDGDNKESIIVDGSGSYDLDGTITSYEWTEGTETLGTNEIITHDFSLGTHTVKLTVTDNGGYTDSDECIITVLANQEPNAEAGPNQEGYVDGTFTFDGSGSFDPDGNIVNYYWEFGDGNYDYGVTVNHIYSAAGTYTVTLTVTDNGGLTNSDQTIITVDEAPSEVEEFFDSFEVGEWNGLWLEDSQNDWSRSRRQSSHGTYAAEVDGIANDATLTMTNPIDLSGKSTATLTFSWYIEKSWDYGEYIILEIYDGSSWNEESILRGNEDTENTWHHMTIDLSPYTTTSNFKIRFRATVSKSNEDGYIDNIKIVSYS